MHDMYGADDNGEYNPIDGDIDPGGTCINCDEYFYADRPRLYCTPLCRDQADYVRYFRRCAADGRLKLDDVADAIYIKRAHILAGGYRAKERELPEDVRDQVKERDRGLCRECGEPGTEVDHIRGSSNALENLQLLCHDCHTDKTKSRIVPLSPGQRGYAEAVALAHELDERCLSAQPLKLCDDHVSWPDEQKRLMKELRETWI